MGGTTGARPAARPDSGPGAGVGRRGGVARVGGGGHARVALGGGLGGQLLGSLLGLGGTAAASGLDVNAIINGFATGGVSGALTALVLGFIKAKLAG